MAKGTHMTVIDMDCSLKRWHINEIDYVVTIIKIVKLVSIVVYTTTSTNIKGYLALTHSEVLVVRGVLNFTK